MIYQVSKTVYNEAMPTYVRNTAFRFNTQKPLQKFLETIGPYQRQHLHSIVLCRPYILTISLDNPEKDGVWGLLADCPNLQQLTVHWMGVRELWYLPKLWNLTQYGKGIAFSLRDALSVRGLSSVNIIDYPKPGDKYNWDKDGRIFNGFQAMDEPYYAEAIKERAARGVTTEVIWRTIFKPIPAKTIV